jgi:hypothetical protein
MTLWEGAAGVSDQAEIKHVRKRLYITDKAPAMSIDSDGYVRCGLSGDMTDQDKLMLGLVLMLKKKGWREKVIASADKHFEGKTTATSRAVVVMELLKS